MEDDFGLIVAHAADADRWWASAENCGQLQIEEGMRMLQKFDKVKAARQSDHLLRGTVICRALSMEEFDKDMIADLPDAHCMGFPICSLQVYGLLWI